MIGKARKYKWLDFTSAIQIASQVSNWYSYILQDIKKDVALRTQSYDRANYHWWFSSETLAWPRLFTFSGVAIWTTKPQRDSALKLIMAQIKPEWNPNIQNRWFYDLNWKTDWWEDRTCKAKVYSLPSVTNWLDDPIIQFSFELYSETEKIYSPTTQIVTWWRWYLGWMTLPATLPNYFTNFLADIEVNNWWDWYAPCKISVVWKASDIQILNLTNGNVYRNNWVTTDFVLDNTNISNNPTELLVVTDLWANIKSNRNSWADIFLNPWLNKLVVLTSDPSETPTVYISWRDTFIW